MNKELARYFFMLIDKDLQFSFNGMGLPNNSCEWLENQLMQENFDKVEEFIKLRYAEQNKKSQKKHKLRAMTNGEYCDKWFKEHSCCRNFGVYTCPNFYSNCTDKSFRDAPCKVYGKYIVVKEKKE